MAMVRPEAHHFHLDITRIRQLESERVFPAGPVRSLGQKCLC
jgi:hypothetical protein